MNIHAGYFSIANPLTIFDKWLNPPKHKETVNVRGKDMLIQWTERAHLELQRRETSLIVEMQLYFTCMVKKRVLFLENIISKNYKFDSIKVNDLFSIAFHPVEAQSCDPKEFARDFPVKRKFDSSASIKMRPSYLEIDYKEGDWVGDFRI